jgi:hypothetical protein
VSFYRKNGKEIISNCITCQGVGKKSKLESSCQHSHHLRQFKEEATEDRENSWGPAFRVVLFCSVIRYCKLLIPTLMALEGTNKYQSNMPEAGLQFLEFSCSWKPGGS